MSGWGRKSEKVNFLFANYESSVNVVNVLLTFCDQHGS